MIHQLKIQLKENIIYNNPNDRLPVGLILHASALFQRWSRADERGEAAREFCERRSRGDKIHQKVPHNDYQRLHEGEEKRELMELM